MQAESKQLADVEKTQINLSVTDDLGQALKEQISSV
jgi:hypothetical protein